MSRNILKNLLFSILISYTTSMPSSMTSNCDLYPETHVCGSDGYFYKACDFFAANDLNPNLLPSHNEICTSVYRERNPRDLLFMIKELRGIVRNGATNWFQKDDKPVSKSRSTEQALKLDGQEKRDPNDPKYRKLAKESMYKYLENTGNTNPHELLEIDSVYTQIVEGLMTRIQFQIFDQATRDVLRCKSKIWERSWLNFKEIIVNCGGAKELLKVQNSKQISKTRSQEKRDPNDPKYRKLAEESMHKYLENTSNTNPHELLEIDSVYTQTVEGLITRIRFQISDQTTRDVLRCKSKIWERSWLNFKEIIVNCGGAKELLKVQNSKQISKTGSQEKRDPNDPKYRKLAEESMHKYLENTSNTNPHELLEIDSVYTQTVEGLMTRIQFQILDQATRDVLRCKSKIWERSWLNFKEIIVNCGGAKELLKVQNSKQISKTGSQEKRDPNDPKYRKLAEQSMHKYLENTGNKNPHELLEIDSVYTQIVGGLITRIHFQIFDQATRDVSRCKSEVWERSWMNFKEIKVNCVSAEVLLRGQNSKHVLKPGGQVKRDPSDPRYRKLAEESMHKYLEITGNKNPHKLLKIDSVFTQIVSGSLTKIQFQISDQTTRYALRCKSEIWEQLWMNFKEIKVNCGGAKIILKGSNSKQKILGSPKKRDPNDPEFKKLAEESLHKYLENTGNTSPHKLLKIDSVYTQTVSGILTTIQFQILDQTTRYALTCKSKIWEKKWLYFKEIKVNCGSAKNLLKGRN